MRELIGVGELESALSTMRNVLRASNSPHLNEGIVLGARLSRLKEKERQGLLTDREAEAARLRAARDLLDLVDLAEGTMAAVNLAIPSPFVDFDAPAASSLEKVFGVSHLRKIAWVREGIEKARSVGRIVTPRGFGTGFLVEGFVVTNHHVLPDTRTVEASSIEFNYEEDTHSKLLERWSYAFEASTAKFSASLDVAVVRLRAVADLPPIEHWGSLELETTQSTAKGDHVSIIQHPEGGPKQIALTNNRIVNVYEHRVQYTTDTLPGASGAPVLSDDWRIVAVHHAGGHLRTNSAGDRLYVNEGISMRAVRQWLDTTDA